MSLKDNLKHIIELAEQVCQSLGLILVDARFGQEGRKHSLQVTIYQPEGRISLADCETVSHKLEAVLDQQSPPLIEGSYVLQVQSPGITRELTTPREFAIFTGQAIEIQARESIPGLGQSFKGILGKAQDGQLIVLNPKPILPATRSKAAHKRPAAVAVTETLPNQLVVNLSKLVSVRLHPEETSFKKA